MSDQQTISKQIEEIHQQVREFIEKQYPEYQVIDVSNASETQYAKTFSRTMPVFHVSGVKANTTELLCEVMINSENEMYIMSETKRGSKGIFQ